MTILDTHAWVWWAAEPEKLSRKARREIDEAQSLGVCAISCWEVAMLVAKGRLELDRPVPTWIDQALGLPRVGLIPLSPAIAVSAAEIGDEFHGDPADRMIVATTKHLSHAVLVTRDREIRDSQIIPTVW